MMLLIKIQMPEGAHLREVEPLIGALALEIRDLLAERYQTELASPVIEEGE